MGGKDTETCGRCSMTSVVGATAADDEDGRNRDPFEGARIEVAESDLRIAAAPAVALGRLERRIDELATRLTYGRP